MNANPTPKDEKETFSITDERSAVWYLRKIRQINEEREAIKAATAQRLQELDADQKRLEHLYGDQLRAWAEQEALRRRRQTVTIPLAGMSCSFRKVPARLEITDKAIAEEIAMSLGYLRTTPDLSAYCKAAEEALEARGEVLPGLDMKLETVAFITRIMSKSTTE